MIIPICSFDAKTGLLCPVCEAKLKDGRISSADVAASKALAQYAEHSKELDSVTLFKSHNSERDFLLEVNEAAIPVLRSEAVRSGLERLIGGRIWVTATASSNRRLIEDLVHPLTISELSTLWLPDGSRVSKVIVGPHGRIVGARLRAAQRLAKVSRGIDLLVEPELREYRSEGTPFQRQTPAILVTGGGR